MKKYLIPYEGTFYKANLHCHTNLSDGTMTPEEVKAHYKSNGYSIVAYTDHCLMFPHHDLADENFLPLTGYENEQVAPDTVPADRRRHCHTCHIALKKDNITMPYYSPGSVWGRGEELMDQVKFNYDNPIENWGYGPEITNKIIADSRDAGFFVTYNHPGWSKEYYEHYSQYTGMCALEIMNKNCGWDGVGDYNPYVYDELLRKGERIYCIAADDNHERWDTCGCWTMIKADKLEYETVTDALVKGNFYASWGPEIHDLWVEDGMVHITTSPAKRIACHYRDRRTKVAFSTAGKPLTEASFPITESDIYFRITVTDEQNRCADTNAYFTDEVL